MSTVAQVTGNRPSTAARLPLNGFSASMEIHQMEQIEMLGLPDYYYARWETVAFDPRWWQAHGISPTIFDQFTSKSKLDTLLTNEVFLIGDTFLINSEHGPGLIKAAELIAFPTTTRITLRLSNGTEVGPIAHPKQILRHLVNLPPAGEATINMGHGWKHIRVRRGGEDLGSMYDMRQSYARWELEMRGWQQVKEDRGGTEQEQARTGNKRRRGGGGAD